MFVLLVLFARTLETPLVSTGKPRPLIPSSWRRTIFNHFHTLSHPSICITRKIISQRFVWRGLNKDVTAWAKSCAHCQSSKIHRHISAPLRTFNLPDRRFDRVHVDIVGPLPLSRGKPYLFTMIDRFTRCPEVFPMSDITTDSCVQAFLQGWISHFGMPLHVTSDRGVQIPLSYGLLFLSGLAFICIVPQPTIHSPTVWWSVFTVT